jgi:hypothetical protein
MPQTDRKEDSTTSVASRGGRNLPSPFKLARVEKTLVPEGGSDQTWYRYVLDNGRSTITGQRSGTLKEVTAYATEYALQLNQRNITGHSAWSPRGKKQA